MKLKKITKTISYIGYATLSGMLFFAPSISSIADKYGIQDVVFPNHPSPEQINA